ncbi:hypothetical protein [Streptomyces sp. NPDC004629]|uniref:hypothetical protein n=1 Tax=Streptomyces sp. NPDC004629 TaxID=3364705 RepID=UPI0036742078
MARDGQTAAINDASCVGLPAGPQTTMEDQKEGLSIYGVLSFGALMAELHAAEAA